MLQVLAVLLGLFPALSKRLLWRWSRQLRAKISRLFFKASVWEFTDYTSYQYQYYKLIIYKVHHFYLFCNIFHFLHAYKSLWSQAFIYQSLYRPCSLYELLPKSWQKESDLCLQVLYHNHVSLMCYARKNLPDVEHHLQGWGLCWSWQEWQSEAENPALHSSAGWTAYLQVLPL